jgi:serine/threonine-protein kinase
VIGKRVAIKVLRHELAASSEAAERFIREARAVNQIEHDNVVDVFAFGRLDDGRLYLVMDLVEGRSLRARLVDGPLEVAAALEILGSIADALDAAHARGVVHRDLKPDNIVLSSAVPPKVFVLDFGLAKLIATASDDGGQGAKPDPATLTGAGTWLGTPAYMAPEQWSVEGAGPASDRYALGVIAFELLAGARPFSASSTPQLMEQHFRAEVPSLASRGGVGLPGSLDRVLRKALAKDPAERFDSARALVAALREAASSADMRARGAIAMPADTIAGKRLWIPATAGVLVLGAGAIAVLVGGKEPARPAQVRAPSTPPAGTVKVTVTSTPPGAEVRRADGTVDTTPAQLFVPPGEPLELTVRKPGYAGKRQHVDVGASGAAVDVKLDSFDGFTGVWQLPSGDLRAFERRDEHVDAFKLVAVSGERAFFTQYAFELTDTGVKFGGADVIADPRAPNEPTCNVRMHVTYVYDPATDKLTQQREFVDLDLVNGKCVQRSVRIVPAELARVDRAPTESHELAMPVGKPAPTKTKTKARPKVSKKSATTPIYKFPEQQIVPQANAAPPQATEPPVKK